MVATDKGKQDGTHKLEIHRREDKKTKTITTHRQRYGYSVAS